MSKVELKVDQKAQLCLIIPPFGQDLGKDAVYKSRIKYKEMRNQILVQLLGNNFQCKTEEVLESFKQLGIEVYLYD